MRRTISKIIILSIITTIILGTMTFADNIKEHNFTNEQIANAIFLAEGGYKADFLYGIVSVKYKDEADARRICVNTIRNNRKRYADYGYKQYSTYLEFLQSRYCPIGCSNDKGDNKYWLKNVIWFLNNSEER